LERAAIRSIIPPGTRLVTDHRTTLYLLLAALLAMPACDGCKKEPAD